MRISYTYKEFENSTLATEYSKRCESLSAVCSPLVAIATLGTAFAFVAYTVELFLSNDILGFLIASCFAILIGLLDFFYFYVRPNNTQCNLKMILAEEKLKGKIEQKELDLYFGKLILFNKSRNLKALKNFLIYYLSALIIIIFGFGAMLKNNISSILLVIYLVAFISFIVIRKNFKSSDVKNDQDFEFEEENIES